jgi:hypothetical protein
MNKVSDFNVVIGLNLEYLTNIGVQCNFSPDLQMSISFQTTVSKILEFEEVEV